MRPDLMRRQESSIGSLRDVNVGRFQPVDGDVVLSFLTIDREELVRPSEHFERTIIRKLKCRFWCHTLYKNVPSGVQSLDNVGIYPANLVVEVLGSGRGCITAGLHVRGRL